MGMVITDYLINKLKEIHNSFEYKGETYTIDCYGDASMQGGSPADSYVYWSSKNSAKRIRMDYKMKKVGNDHYSGIERIKYITFWEDYEEGLVFDEWGN